MGKVIRLAIKINLINPFVSKRRILCIDPPNTLRMLISVAWFESSPKESFGPAFVCEMARRGPINIK